MITAAFDAQYAAWPCEPHRPTTDAVETIDPPRSARWRPGRFRAEVDASEIRGKAVVPVVLRELVRRAEHRPSGVAHECVEAAHPGDGSLDRRRNAPGVADVAEQVAPMEIRDHDVRTFLAEPRGNRLADTRCSTGNDRALSVEARHARIVADARPQGLVSTRRSPRVGGR